VQEQKPPGEAVGRIHHHSSPRRPPTWAERTAAIQYAREHGGPVPEPRACCPSLDARGEPHWEGCSNAWKNDPLRGHMARVWSPSPGALIEMHGGQDYVAAADGSIRRVAALVQPDGDYAVVRARKMTKAQRKSAKRRKRDARNAGGGGGGSYLIDDPVRPEREARDHVGEARANQPQEEGG
jgi:hypothetical protein